jgi:Tol biopolymer transport system component
VDNDLNRNSDVFVRDQKTGAMILVSVSSYGSQGNGYSGGLISVSEDARLVAFKSLATNLVQGDTNGRWDVFVRDRVEERTTRVSVSSSGEQGNRDSESPSISADGRFVAFCSDSSNLVGGDNSTGICHVYVHDRETAQTTRVSVSNNGQRGNSHSEYPSVSADGRFVAFQSHASNLVPLDTNNTNDVFVHDRDTRRTTRVSLSNSGEQASGVSGWPSMSADGNSVAFYSSASNLVVKDTNRDFDIFVRDIGLGQTTRVSVSTGGDEGNRLSLHPGISADGSTVVFMSWATNLVDSDTNGFQDVFVHDRLKGQTTLVSITTGGQQGAHESGTLSAISANGNFVAYEAYAWNLVWGDSNNTFDVFVRNRAPAAGGIPWR